MRATDGVAPRTAPLERITARPARQIQTLTEAIMTDIQRMSQYPSKTYLAEMTYDQAEYFYRNGVISADAWEWYCWKWRNSCYRFSTVAIAYEGQPEPIYPNGA